MIKHSIDTVEANAYFIVAALTESGTGPAAVHAGRQDGTMVLEVSTPDTDTAETFAFRWSLYRGTLKFERDEKLGGGPTRWVVRPWRHVR